MKEYTITIEVDNNVTIEDMQSAIENMVDNSLSTTECFYSIEEDE